MPDKILIIKLGALGDILIASAAIQRIIETYTSEELWVITDNRYQDLFSRWPGLNVQAFPRKGWGSFGQTLRWLRRMRFQRIYDLQSNDRSGILCALSGVPVRIGNHPRFPYTHHPSIAPDRQQHAFERLNLLLASGGIDPAPPSPWFPIREAAKDRVQEWLGQHQLLDENFILLHAAASPTWESKHWPYYGELALTLSEQYGFKIIWIGAGSDKAINRPLAQRVGLDATDCFSIEELVELGRYARFAVTNDSGPMHVLACSGIPIYALFGPTNWQRCHAIGQIERVLVLAVHCSPCHQPVCPPQYQHRCLRALTPELVLLKLQKDGLLPALAS